MKPSGQSTLYTATKEKYLFKNGDFPVKSWQSGGCEKECKLEALLKEDC